MIPDGRSISPVTDELVANIVVTGSRSWPVSAKHIVHNALQTALYMTVIASPWFNVLRVRHGNNYRGVDAITDSWAVSRYYDSVRVERVDADWDAPCRPGTCQPGHMRLRRNGDRYCPAQGNYRNQEMIDRGALAVLAFKWDTYSPGTQDCIDRAIAAEIPVLMHGRPGSQPRWLASSVPTW